MGQPYVCTGYMSPHGEETHCSLSSQANSNPSLTASLKMQIHTDMLRGTQRTWKLSWQQNLYTKKARLNLGSKLTGLAASTFSTGLNNLKKKTIYLSIGCVCVCRLRSEDKNLKDSVLYDHVGSERLVSNPLYSLSYFTSPRTFFHINAQSFTMSNAKCPLWNTFLDVTIREKWVILKGEENHQMLALGWLTHYN